MKPSTFRQFVKTFGLQPLNSVKRTCEILGIRHSKFYELVGAGVFTIIRNGSRSNVTAEQIYSRYLSLISRTPENSSKVA